MTSSRAPDSYSERFVPGRSWSVSSAGETVSDAMKRTFVHELGHHLLMTGGYRIKDLATQSFKYAAESAITRYASLSSQEYFCETLAAYTFHRKELQRHDPGGFAMIEAVKEVLKR